MSIVPRPPKTGGNTTYLAEVADGNTHIKAAEVDDDFNTIYTNVNGLLDNSNIRDNADIATAKIAQDGGLQTGHLADGAVTSAKILDGTIMAVDIAADAITTAKILDGNVTIAKLAPGSTVRRGDGPSEESVTAVTTEATILTFGTFTPAGPESIIAIHVSINLVATIIGTGSYGGTIRLKRNGTTIFSVPYTVAATAPPTTIIPFARSLSAIEALLSGPQDYTVTVDASGSGTITIFSQGAYGTLIEHA